MRPSARSAVARSVAGPRPRRLISLLFCGNLGSGLILLISRVRLIAPPESEQRAFERFRLGLSHRRAKRPAGSCDRLLLRNRRTLVFSSTTAEFCCRNFAPPPPKAAHKGNAFVTISRRGRIVWQGPE